MVACRYVFLLWHCTYGDATCAAMLYMRACATPQGNHIDADKKQQRRANDAMRGEGRKIVQDMMDLTLFPESLDPRRLLESHVLPDKVLFERLDASQLIEPTQVLPPTSGRSLKGSCGSF